MSDEDPPLPLPYAIPWVPGMRWVPGQLYLKPEGYVEDTTAPGYRPRVSKAGQRLYWTLQGPLTSSAISVTPEDLNPDAPREAYFRQTLAGTTWHPISRESITELPQASITVHEEHLEEWQDMWWEVNMEGYDEDVQPRPEIIPPKFDPIVVTASGEGSGEAGPFVTIHDFVFAVHPWLMGHRDNILRAKHVDDDCYTPEANARVLISLQDPQCVRAEYEDEELKTLREVFAFARATREHQHQQQQQHSQQEGVVASNSNGGRDL